MLGSDSLITFYPPCKGNCCHSTFVTTCFANMTKKQRNIVSGHMTDDDVTSHGIVEEPVEDEHSLQTPETQREDDDEDGDTDTDDGAVGDEDIDGTFILGILLTITWFFKETFLDENIAA